MGCWIAPRDVLPGTIYAEEIINAIEYTDALVLICSRHTGDSVHVRSEVEHAFSRKKVIFPVRMDDADLGKALEYFLGTSHWLAAWDSPIEECVERLAESIKRVLGTEAEPAGGHSGSQTPEPKGETSESVLETEAHKVDKSPVGDQTAFESQRQTPNNLPLQTSNFIGREKEGAEVTKLLMRSEVRLVTLTGPGGTGKTRLSLHVAWELLDEFEDGVFFVSLAPTLNPENVGSAIVQEMGFRHTGESEIVETLKTQLKSKALLIVLDNFEQVISAGPIVTALLSACPGLKILVTSREVLHLNGEFDYPVPPLGVPPLEALYKSGGDLVIELTQFDAVKLFITRAQAASPGFAVTDDNVLAIAEICHRLDGLPLAIELAVARLQLMTPQDIAERLVRKLPILGKGARDLPVRQQTLERTIEWSYDLLDGPEKTMFVRMGVFGGGFDLQAAEKVCANPEDPGSGSEPADVIEIVQSLLNKNMLKQDGTEGTVRFKMLETIREYASKRLTSSGEADVIKELHADYYLRLAREGALKLHGPEQIASMSLLKAELPNIRSAFDCHRECGELQTSIETASELYFFWIYAGLPAEGQNWITDLVEGCTEVSPLVRAKALMANGLLHGVRGRWETSIELCGEAAKAARAFGDAKVLVTALAGVGAAKYFGGDYVGAKIDLLESLTSARPLNDGFMVASVLRLLGITEAKIGNYEKAMHILEDSLKEYTAIGDKFGTAYLLRNMGIIPLHLCNYERAASLCRQSLAISHGAEDRWSMAWAMQELAACAALGEKNMVKAARLFGAAEVLREQTATTTPASEQVIYDRSVVAATDKLGEKVFLAEWQRGRAIELDSAVQIALIEPSGEEK